MAFSLEKLHNILLALLLVFSPMQNLFAGTSVDMPAGMGHHNMVHEGSSPMVMDAEQAMSPDCQHCDGNTACQDHNCSHAHCASCVPGLISYLHQVRITAASYRYVAFSQTLSKQHTSHPFRPPRV